MAHRFASLSESSDTLGSAALTGTLVPPQWKSAIFWNVSTRHGVHWNSFVVDWVLLPKFQGLFVPWKARNSLFRSRPLFFCVIALRVYFRRPDLPRPWRASALRRLTENVTCASTRVLCVPFGLDPLGFVSMSRRNSSFKLVSQDEPISYPQLERLFERT